MVKLFEGLSSLIGSSQLTCVFNYVKVQDKAFSLYSSQNGKGGQNIWDKN
jgi:hypothetical protein